MSTIGKDKDLEKGLSTPERTPKVNGMDQTILPWPQWNSVWAVNQTRIVARPKNHEDLSRGWMCGLLVVFGYSKWDR
ncbi:hypothetical protein Bca52824_036009 [Brassica carinata]|uniref:Uncharacterized protein n=1 Tax=Brassica carinata TaxID=52824 RepID=A0A8X7V2B7_BRACI|nr:hypothetical protein Bca52824_036009 [Brassica carinata]